MTGTCTPPLPFSICSSASPCSPTDSVTGVVPHFADGSTPRRQDRAAQVRLWWRGRIERPSGDEVAHVLAAPSPAAHDGFVALLFHHIVR